MLPICISNALLNMCSEPFVMVLNVRAAYTLLTDHLFHGLPLRSVPA